MSDPRTFYDALAADYHLLFADWDTSRRWQGEVLAGLLPRGENLRILDAACGMGTQALALAERGHEIKARDLSPELVLRLQQEARRLGIECPCAVGDMREARAEDAGRFDVVLAFDNALAHLMNEEDLRAAFAAARAALRPGGVFLVSLRDYDGLLEEKPAFDPPRLLGAGQDERIVLQKWSWGPGQEYDMEHILLTRAPAAGWDVASHGVRCRAHRRQELLLCGEQAGFAGVEWLAPKVSGFYQWILRALLLVALLPLAVPLTAQTPPRPNIVLVLADDMGFSDIGCYGGEIRTPTLDRLAAHGARFYNSARCCPTRASLLTGLYPHQAGVGHMLQETSQVGYTGSLNDRCRTLAEVLGSAGYHTCMSGKWHLTRHSGRRGDRSCWPLQRGFDRFYGTITGAGSFYDPATLCRGNTLITPANDPEYRPQTFHYTDAISDQAVRYVREHFAEADGPLFLYVSFTAAHWPLHALSDDIAAYAGAYDGGYEPVRRKRWERLLELGLVDPDWGVDGPVGDWSKVEHKEWEARCMAVYAAQITQMDRGIGRIVAALEAAGVLDDTLFLYLQDNGGCAESFGRRQGQPPAWEVKPMGVDELQKRVWPPMQTRDGRVVRTGPQAMPGPADTFVSYGRAWAHVSNTPFREYKHWVHEGGIATPLIVHWPAGAVGRGSLVREPGHIVDVMATLVDVADAEYPEASTPLEGISLALAWSGGTLPERPLFFEHEGNRAVIDGQWKLVAKGERGPWQLHDLAADRTEQRDRAAAEPEVVARLAAAWEDWARRCHVLPLTPWNKK